SGFNFSDTGQGKIAGNLHGHSGSRACHLIENRSETMTALVQATHGHTTTTPPFGTAAAMAHGFELQNRMVDTAKRSLDRAIARYDAWFLIVVAVILGLGAVITAGIAVWCIVNQKGTFTGNWEFRNFGLHVYFECA
ncbi:MAG: hypothetical protein ACRCY9_10445, partial [Phycicoccus sp.]